jgi:hypothetical protein
VNYEAAHGQKIKSEALSYQMKIVEDRVGIKINLDDKYYDVRAQEYYQKIEFDMQKM